MSDEKPMGQVIQIDEARIRDHLGEMVRGTVEETLCPSSDDLRHIAGFQKGGSGSSVIEIMRHVVDAASDGWRLSGA